MNRHPPPLPRLPPTRLPPIQAPTGVVPALPNKKNFHLYLCCAEEDMSMTADLSRKISSTGYRCAEFFRDGAPNLTVFSQVELFMKRSVWIGLILSDAFLKSRETKYQTEMFLRHVLDNEGKKCVVLLVTDEQIHKSIPTVLMPFPSVCTYKSHSWLSTIVKIIRQPPSSDISSVCGHQGHVDLGSMIANTGLPQQPYTYSGYEGKERIIPACKQRDAQIYLKQRQNSQSDQALALDIKEINDCEQESELVIDDETYRENNGFNGLAVLKRPIGPNAHLKQCASVRSNSSAASGMSSTSVVSGASAISSNNQTDSGITEDMSIDDDILYDSNTEEEEERDALMESYKNVLYLSSSDSGS